MAVAHSPINNASVVPQIASKPVAQAAGCFYPSSTTPLPGLTGLSQVLESEGQRYVLRRTPQPARPSIDRQREFRWLNKLATHQLAPKPLSLTGNKDLLLPWVAGHPINQRAFNPENSELLALMVRLHHLPPLGYRLNLLPLLYRYWQLCNDKTSHWLKRLKILQKQGEPHPLRVAPLHLDLHAGNLIETEQGLVLIDWEYAADGDIALEIAAICLNDPSHEKQWLSAYSQLMQLDIKHLERQVAAWKPWLQLLAASWYQLRYQQTQDKQFQELAAPLWAGL